MSTSGALIGAHVDPTDPVGQARAGGFAIVQHVLGDPRGWKAPTCAHPGSFAGLKAEANAAGVGLYVHAPYVLNVATTNNRIRIPSRKLLQQQLHAAASIGARGLIVHGGHVLAADDPAVGYANWRKCLEGLDVAVPLLIENTAGGAGAMTRTLESVARLWDALDGVPGLDDVGFCLDTCHAHAAGLDLGTLVDALRAITGRLDLVHANDSRDAAGSGADRHANLGQGHLDPDALAHVVAEASAPVILETPGGLDALQADAHWLKLRLAR